ncbi:MAG: BLUF domain-containing protein [Sedimentisphaerales bacterium]|nr:BLUF domain-containing protein [Sedimentisphaerales bacterium]
MSVQMDAFTTEQLICLMYVSSEAKPFTDAGLIDMLLAKRPRYRSIGLTGILLYNEQTFVGVLEGPQGLVKEVYEGICTDCGYKDTSILLLEPIHTRQFHDWTMGFQPNDWLMAEMTPGFNPLMRNPKWSHEDLGVCSGRMFQFLRKFYTVGQRCMASESEQV